MEAPLIEARGLVKSFGSAPVLRGVNFRVGAGAAAMIIGRNGAGKSTLLKILAGLSRPSAGEALIFGSASLRLDSKLRHRLGLLSHQSALYQNLTARENLEFYGRLYRLPGVAALGSAWLDRVGLAAAADQQVRTFSRGMEQRLALARAMMAAPEVILMDEPFAALDRDGVNMVNLILRDALARHCAIALTAHEPLALEGATFELFELVRGRLHTVSGGLPGGALRQLQTG